MRKSVFALGLLILLAGCGDESWQTKDIAGLMPPLELHLSGTEGAPLTEADLRGDTVLLFFGYTQCPDVCPGTLAKLSGLRKRLPAQVAEEVRVVLVSVDPARDSPAKLTEYTDHFGEGIVGVTGTEQELRALARRYRTTYSYGEPDEDGYYEVAHSNGIYVFDRSGHARLLFRQDDSVEAMRADLMRLSVQ